MLVWVRILANQVSLNFCVYFSDLSKLEVPKKQTRNPYTIETEMVVSQTTDVYNHFGVAVVTFERGTPNLLR